MARAQSAAGAHPSNIYSTGPPPPRKRPHVLDDPGKRTRGASDQIHWQILDEKALDPGFHR